MPDNKDSALRDAIHNRLVDRVRSLISDGADVRSMDDKGMTPLMVAASIGSPEIVDLLIAAGADVTAKDKLGYTAQDLAYWHGEYHLGAYTPESLRIVEALKKAGGDMRRPNYAPAPNRRPRFPLGTLGEFDCHFCAPPAYPAAAGEAQRQTVNIA